MDQVKQTKHGHKPRRDGSALGTWAVRALLGLREHAVVHDQLGLVLGGFEVRSDQQTLGHVHHHGYSVGRHVFDGEQSENVTQNVALGVTRPLLGKQRKKSAGKAACYFLKQ